jgi:hypothetical protein
MAYGIEERISKPALLAFKAMDCLVACSLKNLKALAIENVTAFSYVLLLSFFFLSFFNFNLFGKQRGEMELLGFCHMLPFTFRNGFLSLIKVISAWVRYLTLESVLEYES